MIELRNATLIRLFICATPEYRLHFLSRSFSVNPNRVQQNTQSLELSFVYMAPVRLLLAVVDIDHGIRIIGCGAQGTTVFVPTMRSSVDGFPPKAFVF
jgi:hypothetical protein